VPTATRRLKHWGWGYEDQQPPRDRVEGIAKAITERLGFEVDEIEEPVPLDAVEVPEPRLKPPKRFAELFSDDRYERVSHSLGKAYRDVVRGFRGEFPNPPDLVAYPESPEDVDLVLNFCADEGAAAIPYGGGTSVVGGVEPRMRDEYPGVVTIDLKWMDRGLEVDPISMAAPPTIRPGMSSVVTVTVNEPVAVLPCASLVEQDTVVTAIANVLPEAGAQMTGRVPSTRSVEEAE